MVVYKLLAITSPYTNKYEEVKIIGNHEFKKEDEHIKIILIVQIQSDIIGEHFELITTLTKNVRGVKAHRFYR